MSFEETNNLQETGSINAEASLLQTKVDNEKSNSSNADDKPLLSEEEVGQLNIVQVIEAFEKILQSDSFPKIKQAYLLLKKHFDTLLEHLEQEEKMKLIEAKSNTEVEASIEKIGSEFYKLKFNELFKEYTKRKKEYNAQIEKEKLQNLEAKKQLLNEFKEILNSNLSLQKIDESIREIKEKWYKIGQVPLNEHETLWNDFNFLIEQYHEKIKLNNEARDLDYKRNLEAKIEICEKIEKLLLANSVEYAFKKMKEYVDMWREIGPVPIEYRDEIRQRFAEAQRRIKEKRTQFYEEQNRRFEQNLEIKKALILKLKEINEKELQTAKEWKEHTELVEELFMLWQNAGEVKNIYKDKIWEEFKAEMNLFYENKKLFFDNLKSELNENYNKKLNLCIQAEALQNSTDWKRTSEQLIKLQNEWKTIGPVSREHSDELWNRFRAACNTFFNRKKEYFNNIDKYEQENLEQKKALIEEVKNYNVSADKKQVLEDIQQFRRKFMEIGNVPKEHKQKIQDEFNEAINQILNKINVNKKEQVLIELKNKYEKLKSTEAGQAELKKEIYKLTNTIKKLEDDIRLWENNLNFFSNSKNSAILTVEFKQKIEKAKADLLILKEKLKVLNNIAKQ